MRIKKLFKIFLLVLLMFLATVGIGMTGAAPVITWKRFVKKRKQNNIELKQERKKDKYIKEF